MKTNGQSCRLHLLLEVSNSSALALQLAAQVLLSLLLVLLLQEQQAAQPSSRKHPQCVLHSLSVRESCTRGMSKAEAALICSGYEDS